MLYVRNTYVYVTIRVYIFICMYNFVTEQRCRDIKLTLLFFLFLAFVLNGKYEIHGLTRSLKSIIFLFVQN